MTPSPLSLHSSDFPVNDSKQPILRNEKLHQEEPQSPYNEAFENDLAHILLHPNSPRQPQDQRIGKEGEEPLPLTSQERKFEVFIPARPDSGIDSTLIKTTHPHGSIFGGENPQFPFPNNLFQHEIGEQVLERASAFVKEAGITSRKQLVEILDKQMDELLRQVEARSRNREAAFGHNKRVEEEKRVLEEENEMIRKGVMRNMGR